MPPTTRGYARALAPREFHFPADLGAHPKFRTEWWYYTGNLATAAGRRFGFQLTFFRSALAPPAAGGPARTSAWATRQAWLAHFTVSDVQGGKFHSFERWSRGAVGLAGAEQPPFRVWVKDWKAEAVGGEAPPMHLVASEGDSAIDLTLQPGKPPVLQGDHGLSRKGAEVGNASYYYSLTRMPTAGTVSLDGQRFAVSGAAWMDREWSTLVVTARRGRAWRTGTGSRSSCADGSGAHALPLAARRRLGRPGDGSSGTAIGPGGETGPLSLPDFQIASAGTWQSPRGGARYPARWHVRVPGEGLDLEVRPRLADQELDAAIRYWEGAVAITGTRRGRPIQGEGYVELTGYR